MGNRGVNVCVHNMPCFYEVRSQVPGTEFIFVPERNSIYLVDDISTGVSFLKLQNVTGLTVEQFFLILLRLEILANVSCFLEYPGCVRIQNYGGTHRINEHGVETWWWQFCLDSFCLLVLGETLMLASAPENWYLIEQEEGTWQEEDQLVTF